MKIKFQRSRGSALLVVLVLLAVMVLLTYVNSITLHVLKQEINLVDKKQQRKYGQNPGH